MISTVTWAYTAAWNGWVDLAQFADDVLELAHRGRCAIRGYTGDRTAPARLTSSLFDLAGQGFQRPFELATVRLNNMVEVLGRWRTYVPEDNYLCQRGGTYLLDETNDLLYSHHDRGILWILRKPWPNL